MDKAVLRQLLNDALVELDRPDVVASATLKSSDNLASILAAAPAGATVYLDPLGRWDGPLTLNKPVSLIGRGLSLVGRLLTSDVLPWIVGEVKVTGPNVMLHGIEFHNPNKDQAIVSLEGDNPYLSQVRVLGDPIVGQKRGIAGNAANVVFVDSHVDHIFHSQDAQAFCAWDTPGPITIDNCYLSASGETVMFGGADPASADRIPSDITLSNSTLTKRLEWKGQPGLTVKNTLEFKNARRAKVTGCLIEHSWQNGQTGFLVMLTPRNQGGTAPYSTVEDITIKGNKLRGAAAAFSILGADNHSPGSTLKRVSITENTVTEIDPLTWGGDTRLILLDAGCDDVTIARNTFEGLNIRTAVSLNGALPYRGLNITGNSFPKTKYAILGQYPLVSMLAPGSTVNPNIFALA